MDLNFESLMDLRDVLSLVGNTNVDIMGKEATYIAYSNARIRKDLSH